MFPETIQSSMTIYNIYNDLEMQASVLHGVFWRSLAASVISRRGAAATGIATDDQIVCSILADTLSGDRKFLHYDEWEKLSKESKQLYWTLNKGDKIINRVVTESFNKPNDLEKHFGYDTVFEISQITYNLFGSPDMRHFEIIGK